MTLAHQAADRLRRLCLARIVSQLVRSANCCSLMRFHISPRLQYLEIGKQNGRRAARLDYSVAPAWRSGSSVATLNALMAATEVQNSGSFSPAQRRR